MYILIDLSSTHNFIDRYIYILEKLRCKGVPSSLVTVVVAYGNKFNRRKLG